MSPTRSKRNLCYSLCLLCVFLCLCGSNGTQTDFEIFRTGGNDKGRDIFKNLKCDDDPACESKQCKGYGATCYYIENLPNCTYCQCKITRKTFLISEDNSSEGECKSDENIIPKSVPAEGFWLRNEDSQKCLKAPKEYLEETDCSKLSLDALWVWTPTSTGSKQLMNVKTLKCIQKPTDNGKVIMARCRKNLAEQNISCSEDTNKVKRMKIGWNGESFLSLSPEGYAISEKITRENDTKLWSNNKTSPCETEETYQGCYRISTSNSLMGYYTILRKRNTSNIVKVISAPILAENELTCSLRQSFASTRSGKEWKNNTGNPFAIRKKNKSPFFYRFIIQTTEEDVSPWNGSLLKLSVFCESGVVNEPKEEHCILVKLETVPTFDQVHSHRSTDPTMMSVRNDQLTTVPSVLNSTTSVLNGETEGRTETSESDETKSVVIAVTVTLLVVALALALAYLVYFFRRKRLHDEPPNNMEEIETVDNSKGLYEDPDRIYEELRDEGFFDVPREQPGTSSDPYNLPDSTILANPALTELEYTYAKDIDMPRITKNTKEAPEEPTSPYHILEEEQPSDSKDDRIDNNNIANPASTCFQHAKDTDLYKYPDSTILSNPTLTEQGNTNAEDNDMPKTTEDEKTKDLTSRLYQNLLKQEKPSNSEFNNPNNTKNSANPVSTNLEHTQPMDTDLPTATSDEKTDTERDTTPVPNDALYHILEQETSAPTEPPECSNAKNTNNTSIPTDMQETAQGNSATPTNSTLCNSLEEQNAPQTVVKSTLEEPENEENSVADEIPNGGDLVSNDHNGTDFRNPDNSSTA